MNNALERKVTLLLFECYGRPVETQAACLTSFALLTPFSCTQVPDETLGLLIHAIDHLARYPHSFTSIYIYIYIAAITTRILRDLLTIEKT